MRIIQRLLAKIDKRERRMNLGKNSIHGKLTTIATIINKVGTSQFAIKTYFTQSTIFETAMILKTSSSAQVLSVDALKYCRQASEYVLRSTERCTTVKIYAIGCASQGIATARNVQMRCMRVTKT
jgi:hypothetical protein